MIFLCSDGILATALYKTSSVLHHQKGLIQVQFKIVEKCADMVDLLLFLRFYFFNSNSLINNFLGYFFVLLKVITTLTYSSFIETYLLFMNFQTCWLPVHDILC